MVLKKECITDRSKIQVNKHAKSNPSYQNWDLLLMENNIEEFCIKSGINYPLVKTIGINEAKTFLRKFYYDEFDGNMTKQDCELMYALINDPWECSKLERHKILADLIKESISHKNAEFNDILILGAGLGGEFNQVKRILPHAKYVITDISKNAIRQFKHHYRNLNNFKTAILDIFDTSSLINFASTYGIFDLIIASGVYRYAPTLERKNYSANFIYSNFLKLEGFFYVVEVRQHKEKDSALMMLSNNQPIYNKFFQTKDRINPTQFVIYNKTNEKRSGW